MTVELAHWSEGRTRLALGALFLGAFVIGSAELLVVGILTPIAHGLHVSTDTAGGLVTAYAMSICIGGPLLTAATIRLSRRTVLRVSLLIYVLANLLAAVSSGYGELLAARVISGLTHGIFIGVAFTVAAQVVPPARMGWALSIVFGGISVSTAIGVPLGTLVGQTFGWHAAFFAIVAFGIIALVAILAFVPAVPPSAATAPLGTQLRRALSGRMIAVLAVGFVLMGGEFAALTYLTPFLQQRTGVTGSLVAVFVLAFGVASAVGTFLGGRAADRSAKVTLRVANILLIAFLAVLYFFGEMPVIAAVAIFAWGLVGYGLIPALQHRTISLAGEGRDFAPTLLTSAVTGGIAVGALVGGWALVGFGPSAPILVGVIASVLVLPATWVVSALRPTPVTVGAPA